MSREQWGHGYWTGVKAAQNGDVKENSIAKYDKAIHEKSLFYIAHMVVSNEEKREDKCLYPVSQLISLFMFEGFEAALAEQKAKEIYDFVMSRRPLRSYISGCPKDRWTEDYFVLPNIELKEALGIIESLQKKWAKENGFDQQWGYESSLLEEASEYSQVIEGGHK